MSNAPRPASNDLPADLADQAIEQFLAAEPASRAAVCAAFQAAHPEHALALRVMFADLAGTEQLLESSFPEQQHEGPQSIGGCRVLRCLGEGAFGIVHLCEQEHPVRRTVAIKVLRPGAGDRQTLRRFEAERQLLASLNHGSITQIFDAGHLPDGRPYFVMEFVDGLPITTYVEHHELDCAARLRLFVELCLGIEHAHARGIVHRDLKPANVLVVDSVPAPLPKIIDFGIAKALNAPRLGELGAHGSTDPGRVIGTPGYMSPEQAAGQADEVDARADVFALGVMLYELLTGELPWERGESATDRDPELPSARVTTRNRPITESTAASPRRLAALLRGDLDWITLKALSRERERRYQTVRELIDDIERHRKGLPVLAGPPSTSYRIAKFVRRNRTAIVSLGGALVAIGAALALSLAFAARADEAQAQARTEAAASFVDATAAVEQLLARANDERIRRLPQSDGVRQLLLQDALTFYDRWLGQNPAEPGLQFKRCQALALLSRVHWQLGQMADAQRIADEACSVARALVAADETDIDRRALLADAERKRGTALASVNRVTDALAQFEEATRLLEVCHRAAPAVHGLAYSSALREVAMMLQSLSRIEESLASFRASLQVLEAMLPSSPPDSSVHSDVVVAGAGLAQQLLFANRPDDAEQLLLQAESRLPGVNVDPFRVTAMVESLLGRLAQQRGTPAAAIPHVTAALAAARRWREAEPQRVEPGELEFTCARQLGAVHDQAGAWDDANAAYRTAIGIAEALVAQFPADPKRLTVLAETLRDLSRALWDRFRFFDLAEAETWARRAVEIRATIEASSDGVRRGERWQYDMMVARIEDCLGKPSDATWEHIATALERHLAMDPTTAPQALIEAWVGVARSRLARGQFDACALALTVPREALAKGLPLKGQWIVEIERTDAMIACARGAHAEAAAAADRIVAARPTWMGRLRAAESLCGAWRCAAATPDPGPKIGDAYRDRADKLLHDVTDSLAEDVSANPDDPWYVVPWGFANVMRAQIEVARGDRPAAARLLLLAMPALRRVETSTLRDQWNDATWRAANDLELSLAAGTSR